MLFQKGITMQIEISSRVIHYLPLIIILFYVVALSFRNENKNNNNYCESTMEAELIDLDSTSELWLEMSVWDKSIPPIIIRYASTRDRLSDNKYCTGKSRSILEEIQYREILLIM